MEATGIIDIAHSIQLAVAPVFLLSGVGVTLTVLTNRLGRIIDRARLLEGRPTAAPEPLTPEALHELADLRRRARLIQRAITLSIACAILIALVITCLFAGAALGRDLTRLIVFLFTAGLVAFIAALLLFLVEIWMATASLRLGPDRP